MTKTKEFNQEVKKLIQETASRLRVDPFLMLALAEIESSFFPYRVSQLDAYGIFQIRQPAIDEIKKEGKYQFMVTDPFF